MKRAAFDYEGVFPGRASRDRESTTSIESWPSDGKLKHFDDPEYIAASAPAPLSNESQPPSSLLSQAGTWVRRRGHGLSFACLFLFSVVLYLRPYELFPALSSFKSMAFYIGLVTLVTYAFSQLAVEGNLTARPREVNLILLMGLLALITMPLAIDPSEAWKIFSEQLIKALLIFVVIVNVVRTKSRLYLLIWLALGVSIYLSINAIQDYQSGAFQFGKEVNNNLRIAGRIKGLFENSNDLALHFVTMIPIAIGLAFVKRGLFAKILYIGTAVLMVAATVVTFSRGGFIGLVAISFLLVRKLGRRNRLISTAGFVLAIVLFVGLAPGEYGGRLSTIFNTAGDVTGSASQRNQVLQRSVLVALRYPLYGVGLGNFHHKSFQELGTHNAYSQVASEVGIPAMVLYMMFLIYPYKKLHQIENETYERSKQKDERFFYYLSVGLQASLVGYMVASFFAAVAYQWYIYYLVGYAIAMRRMYSLRAQTMVSNTSSNSFSSEPAESFVR
jgi:O-antigen ligase/polysaccharide polymerase Wzy-like membrane protein